MMRLPAGARALVIGLTSAVVLFAAYRLIVGDAARLGEQLPVAATASSAGESPPIAAAERARTDGAPSADERPRADARRDELLAMSESFRNTSLVIAIRDAGFRCEHLAGVEQGGDGVAAWRVSCEDALVYWAGIGDDGEIAVDSLSYTEDFVPFPGEVIQPEEGQSPESVRPLR